MKSKDKKLNTFFLIKHKYLSPIIGIFLLIVVSVILVAIFTSWSSNLTIKNLDAVNDNLREDDTFFGFFQVYSPRNEGFILKNLSKNEMAFTDYKLISEEYFPSISNVLLPFESQIKISAGGQAKIPILCYPSSSFKVNLITVEGTYITVLIENADFASNFCGDLDQSNDPIEGEDLTQSHSVCLGLSENGFGNSISDPIVICSVEDLNDIRTGLNKYYLLGLNLDLNISPYNDTNGWLPIGNSSDPFTGYFDGNGYTIKNLYINRPTMDYVGLFGYVSGALANITDLKIVDANIFGNFCVGGLTGFNDDSTVSKISLSGSIIGNYRVGGLIGYNNYGFVDNSVSDFDINGIEHLGGLIGTNWFGEIDLSASQSSVFGIGNNVGGLVGSNYGSVINSYSIGTVVGAISVGGLIGYNDNCIIQDNYSLTNVFGVRKIGGLIGKNYNAGIINSYSAGLISGELNELYIGGLIGESVGKWIFENSFWDMNTSNQTTSFKGLGLTKSQMKESSNFTDWDFNTIWQIQEGVTYPYLRSNPQSPPPQ